MVFHPISIGLNLAVDNKICALAAGLELLQATFVLGLALVKLCLGSIELGLLFV